MWIVNNSFTNDYYFIDTEPYLSVSVLSSNWRTAWLFEYLDMWIQNETWPAIDSWPTQVVGGVGCWKVGSGGCSEVVKSETNRLRLSEGQMLCAVLKGAGWSALDKSCFCWSGASLHSSSWCCWRSCVLTDCKWSYQMYLHCWVRGWPLL